MWGIISNLSTPISIFAFAISILTFIFTWVRDRKINTIEAYQNLQKSLAYLNSYQRDDIETFVTKAGTEEYKVISGCIADIEIFARGLKTHVYNYRLFYSIAHGFIDGSLRDGIEHILDMKDQSVFGEYYMATKWLFKKMDKTTNRKCFYNEILRRLKGEKG